MASLWPARRATALAELSGGDQVGTAARDGGAGTVADDVGGQGDGEALGDGADLGSEARIGSQGLCFVGEEAGHGEPSVAMTGHRVNPRGAERHRASASMHAAAVSISDANPTGAPAASAASAIEQRQGGQRLRRAQHVPAVHQPFPEPLRPHSRQRRPAEHARPRRGGVQVQRVRVVQCTSASRKRPRVHAT